ncbi:MAG: hypothetical protein LQ337_004481 [Flavoplaca oasis]|nr:MAG: hypothetical protein LQ337_004481 [Flavoplaca oasis]
MKLSSLLFLTSLLSLASATCHRDNCLRALAATPTKASSFCATYTKTQNTATPIPTYGSFCANSPSRASSACSCVVTSTPTSAPTCVPSPVINAATRNGNFEDYPPPGQGVFNIQPPCAFILFGQQPNVLPGAVLRLSQPITYCNGTTYAFSLYARQLQSLTSQTCRLTFFSDFEGSIASFETPAFGEEFQKFGPVTRRPFRDNGVRNAKGEWEDRLDILVQCTGIEGREVVDTMFEVDNVRVEPAVGERQRIVVG